jgi:hypothetical protein
MRLESVYGFLWLAGISPPIAWAIPVDCRRRYRGGRVLGMGEVTPAVLESCGSL